MLLQRAGKNGTPKTSGSHPLGFLVSGAILDSVGRTLRCVLAVALKLKIVLEKPIRRVYSPTMNKKTLREVMGYLGSIKSAAKAKASRQNGKLGGRPRIHPRKEQRQ
jgi:hypothetical protein